jgi:predicted HTH transcriptional regulator
MDADVKNMIRFGEDSVCEFKSIRIPGKRVAEPEVKDVADEIAAAANAAGAVFLFGINDKTKEVEVIPEDKLDIAEAWLRNICNDSVKPAVVATIRKIAVCDSAGIERCVIRVDVPKSLFVHESPHGYFYRSGSSPVTNSFAHACRGVPSRNVSLMSRGRVSWTSAGRGGLSFFPRLGVFRA